MTTPLTGLQSGNGRVWLQKDGANTAFQFLTAYGAGAVQRPAGTITPYYEPSAARYNEFRVTGKTKSVPGLPTSSLEVQYQNVASLLLGLSCPAHVQYRFGVCDRPDNPNAWDKILHLYLVEPGAWGLSNPIARDPSSLAPVLETLELTAEELFEILAMTVARVSVAETGNALSIAISRVANCAGLCGPAVSICDEIFVGTHPSAYATANLLRSSDAGATFAATTADPLSAGNDIIGVLTIGDRVIAIDGDAATPTIAYSDDNGATWTTVTYAGGAVGDLNDGFAVDWSHLYFAGNGGYLYISTDGGGTLTAQTAGVVTTDNLNRVRVLTSLVGYAVGNMNTVLKTTDGETWAAITGPEAGATLQALWVIDENRVWVGTSAGKLWYTDDGGTTWTQRSGWSNSGTGAITAIEFVNEEFGFMVHETAAGVGRIFRTIDGGLTWNYGVGGMGTTATNAGLNALAVCGVNSAFAVGDVQGGTAFIVAAS